MKATEWEQAHAALAEKREKASDLLVKMALAKAAGVQSPNGKEWKSIGDSFDRIFADIDRQSKDLETAIRTMPFDELEKLYEKKVVQGSK